MLATLAVLSREDVGAARRLSDAQTAAPAPVRAAANLTAAGNSPTPLRLGSMVDGWVVLYLFVLHWDVY